MRDFLADWALRRARKAALDQPDEFWRRDLRIRLRRHALARSEWWHDIAAWLDGFGEWPGLKARFPA